MAALVLLLLFWNVADFVGIDPFFSQYCFIALQSTENAFVYCTFLSLSQKLWWTKNALNIMPNAGVAWALLVTSDFPLRAPDAGEGGPGG